MPNTISLLTLYKRQDTNRQGKTNGSCCQVIAVVAHIRILSKKFEDFQEPPMNTQSCLNAVICYVVEYFQQVISRLWH